jgi:hypothetical protein
MYDILLPLSDRAAVPLYAFDVDRKEVIYELALGEPRYKSHSETQ